MDFAYERFSATVVSVKCVCHFLYSLDYPQQVGEAPIDVCFVLWVDDRAASLEIGVWGVGGDYNVGQV